MKVSFTIQLENTIMNRVALVGICIMKVSFMIQLENTIMNRVALVGICES